MENLTDFLMEFRYVAVFIGTIVEGPTVGLLAGVFAKIGYFSLPVVYAVHVIGDTLADIFFYAIGYFGGHRALPKIGKYLKITAEDIEKAEKALHGNGKKLLIVGKITHVVGFPLIIASGITKYPIGKFIICDAIATIIKSAYLIALGYFFGSYWGKINNIMTDIGLAGLLLILVPIIYFYWSKAKKKLK